MILRDENIIYIFSVFKSMRSAQPKFSSQHTVYSYCFNNNNIMDVVNEQRLSMEALGTDIVPLVQFTIFITLVGAIVLYQLFYNGRIFARLVSRLLQRSLGDHYQIRLGTLNVALIGGRLIFSEFLYSTQNITIRVVDGTFKFR